MNIPNGFKLVPVEPTEEIIRSMLAVRWPATYRNTLRFSGAGPATAAQCERDIAEAKEQFGAMLDAAQTPPKPIYDEAKERVLFESTRNAHTVRRNEHGDYVLTSAQDAWSGWSQCAQSRAKYVEVGDE